jgi:diamine N-acetyltransferase
MIEYRLARMEDGPELAALAREVFAATFAHLYPPEDFEAFAGEAFGSSGLPAQIGHPDYTINLALQEGRIVGFAKLGPVAG